MSLELRISWNNRLLVFLLCKVLLYFLLLLFLFLFPEIPYWLRQARSLLWFVQLEVTCSVWFMGKRRARILLIEWSDDIASEILNWIVVKRQETKKIVKIILCESTVIDSLEFGVKIDSFSEWFFLIPTEKTRKQVINRKLTLSTTIQKIESFVDFFANFFIDLTFQVIYKYWIIN